MRRTAVVSITLLVAACGDAALSTPPEIVPAPSTTTPAVPDPASSRDTWIADIRSDVASLYFGHPNSGWIAFTLRCKPRSGLGAIIMPVAPEPLISLASGANTETLAARIEPGGETDDSLTTTEPVDLQRPIWISFRQTGELRAERPDRDFTAPTAGERDEIAAFFAACDR